MRTLRRTVAVLVVPAIAWLGVACERMDTPTQPLPPAAFDHTSVISTVTLASSPAWGGQHVCLNAAFPALCPADATQYGYVGGGWGAPRPPGANWIWLTGVTGETRPADLVMGSFSQTVQLGTPIAGQICLAADDYAALFVNGDFVGEVGSITNPAAAGVAQNNCMAFNVTPHLQAGSNTIEVRGQNGPSSFAIPPCGQGGCSYSQNPAGVMFGGTLTSSCPVEHDDDNDGLNNTNEHLLGLLLNDSDSDDDGVVDGNDDGNGNGEDDEDEDDDDECPDPDSDGDGEDDEDEDDDDGDDDD
jgi:hypothetical protein